jgi:hypothetical protein
MSAPLFLGQVHGRGRERVSPRRRVVAVLQPLCHMPPYDTMYAHASIRHASIRRRMLVWRTLAKPYGTPNERSLAVGVTYAHASIRHASIRRRMLVWRALAKP